MSSQNSGSFIEIQNISKIFGNTSAEALEAITKKNISKQDALEKYNSVIGVSDVSFDINPGEIFCVMGLSGSGKSTLVRHINRLLEPTLGKILIDGQDVMALNKDELQEFRNKKIGMVFQNFALMPHRSVTLVRHINRLLEPTLGKILIDGQDVMALNKDELQEFRNKKIGMVFQNFALMPHRSVIDNIAMPLEIRGVNKNNRYGKANEILNIVELTGWGNKYAHELSGGMQQRVGLARALAADPEILLMDEPFSALDPLIRRQLQIEFIKLSKKLKKTTVFITHDLDEAVKVGHRIAIMRDGKVIQVGTPEEIVMKPEDDYVADFVKGISRLEVVKANSIMTPLDEYSKNNGDIPQDAIRMNEGDILSSLIENSVSSDIPIVITNRSGQDVGVISHKDLLLSIVEGQDE